MLVELMSQMLTGIRDHVSTRPKCGDWPTLQTKRRLDKESWFFKDDTEEPLTFNILADHQYSIPDGSYTLIGCKRRTYDGEEADGTDRFITIISEMWVVGRQRPGREV